MSGPHSEPVEIEVTPMEYSYMLKPMRLPPGFATLVTKPLLSVPSYFTNGVVRFRRVCW